MFSFFGKLASLYQTSKEFSERDYEKFTDTKGKSEVVTQTETDNRIDKRKRTTLHFKLNIVQHTPHYIFGGKKWEKTQVLWDVNSSCSNSVKQTGL